LTGERRLAGKLVLPGEALDPDVQGEPPFVIEEGGVKRATVVGLVRESEGGKKSFVRLKGVYVPKPGDIVIGMISGVGVMNWFVDINSPYTAVLNVQDFLGRPYNPAIDDMSLLLRIGDYVKAKVAAFDRTRNPVLTVQGKDLGRITTGIVVEIAPSKVPRVIGRKRSMLSMLEEKTGCTFFVAVNGRIHVECPNKDLEAVAVLALKFIEREAHTAGLTERVMRLIEEERRIREA
jgi:exosome complex component RRP4